MSILEGKGPDLIANVCSSNYRGQDTLGFELMSTAAQLESKLPFHLDDERSAMLAVSARTYQKARLSVHWMVKCIHM